MADDGIGFSKHELKELDEQHRIKNKDRLNNHLGIGLYLCDLLCRKHGGELELQNSEEGGLAILKFNINS